MHEVLNKFVVYVIGDCNVYHNEGPLVPGLLNALNEFLWDSFVTKWRSEETEVSGTNRRRVETVTDNGSKHDFDGHLVHSPKPIVK